MQVVSELQCVPARSNTGSFFEDVLYQRRLRGISQLMFRNLVFTEPLSIITRMSVCIKTVAGTTLHDSHDLDVRSNFFYRNFTLGGAGYDHFLSTKIFIVELLIDSRVAHQWKVNTSDLTFIGSVQSGGDDIFDSSSKADGASMHFLSRLLFSPNSLVCVFNDAFYCNPDSISNIGAFPNSTVYPRVEPPLIQEFHSNRSGRFWVLDEQKLRAIHSESLMVHQRRKERNRILNEVNKLDDTSASIQSKLQKLEYLSQKMVTMNTERTRLMCENENFRITIQEKTKHSTETESIIQSLKSQISDSMKQMEELRAKLEELYQECSLVRKKKQIVQGYLLQELQTVFSITEKSHSPLDLKSGKFGAFIFSKISNRSNANVQNGSPHLGSGNLPRKELVDTQWYICGIWLPKSGVFDPGYQQQVLAAAQSQSSLNSIANRSIDASKVDDFEIVTAVCYVAWVLVIMSQITGTILRYQIDMKSPTRWFVYDNQIELREYRDNREYELANDRKLRVKDDIRFLHALFCINKNIGQLRYKLNLGFNSRDSFTIHRTLRDLNMVLRSLANKKRLLTTYQKIVSYSDLTKLDLSKNRTDNVPIITDVSQQKLISQYSLRAKSPTVVEFSVQVPQHKSSAVSAESGGAISNVFDNLNDDLEAMFDVSSVKKTNLVSTENGLIRGGANVLGERSESFQQRAFNFNVSRDDSIAKVSFTGLINGRNFDGEQEGEEDSSSSSDEEMIANAASAVNQTRRRLNAMGSSLNRSSGIKVELIE